MSKAQEACVFASFILDGGDAATITKVCKAAGIDVPASLADAFGKKFKSSKVGDLVKNIGAGGAAAGAAPAAAAAAPAAKGGKKEEKKKEPEPEEEDDDIFGGGLF